MKEKDFTYFAEEFKREIDNEISYIYSCFVPADVKNVLAVMKGNIALADREFLNADTRVSVGNRWTCPYDLLLERVESKIEDFYTEFDLSSKTIEKLSQYGERAEAFKKEFRENLEKSEQTTKNQLLRELELMVMQGKDVKTVLKHMNTAIEKRTNALNSLLSSSAGQMEWYMILWDYQDRGFTRYRFITVGDNCEHCTELNGKVFDIKDVTNFPPLHPNCNCRAEILDKDGNSVATIEDIDTDDKLDYLKTSLKQILLGNYTEDTNLLGILGQVALGFFGLDLPADLRDLVYDITHWKLTPSHALQTILDAAALLPVVGSLKYTDEAIDAVKGIAKSADNYIRKIELREIFGRGSLAIEDIQRNSSLFSGLKAEELVKVLKEDGYNLEVFRSAKSKSGAQIIRITNNGNGRNISQIQISPGGGRHGINPYIKISTTDQGTIKIVDGLERNYITDGKETSKIIFIGGN